MPNVQGGQDVLRDMLSPRATLRRLCHTLKVELQRHRLFCGLRSVTSVVGGMIRSLTLSKHFFATPSGHDMPFLCPEVVEVQRSVVHSSSTSGTEMKNGLLMYRFPTGLDPNR